MDYILDEAPERGRNRRPLLLTGAIFLAVVVATMIAVTMYQVDAAPEESVPAELPPSALPASGPGITWTNAGSQPVPGSTVHGPSETANGLAAGFSHDELGAVLAAINISARLSAQAGPAVYEATAREQCFGDVDATIEAIRAQRSNAASGATSPTEFFYRVTGGDPRGDLVSVSVALETPQSRSLGGYAELERTLQWIQGDWRVQAPPAPPRLISSLDDYSSLGRPNG